MLAVAGGMAFPGADAAAQSAQGGYTYTQRVCQEYGQQPRYYGVRDGQAAYNGGNSDSGWLIVLERGTSLARTVTFTQGSNPERTSAGFNTAYNPGALVVDNSGGVWDGYQGVIALGSTFQLVGIDANRDGAITAADEVFGTGQNRVYVLFYAISETLAGGSYIRWAHMMWCR